jgi:hypothetical protein
MKKHKIVPIIIFIIAIIALSVYFIYNRDKYRNIKITDLNGENINGISLMEKYNESDIEKKFGKVTTKSEDKNYRIYGYYTQQYDVSLHVDKDNNIMKINAGFPDTFLKTNRGITKGSTFADVEKYYGSNYLKKKHGDFMMSGDWYTITYVDKNNRSKITFVFSELNNWELSSISLCRY